MLGDLKGERLDDGILARVSAPAVPVDGRARPAGHGAARRCPRYMTAGAAGMDLLADLDAALALAPGERALVPTGIAIALPAGLRGAGAAAQRARAARTASRC